MWSHTELFSSTFTIRPCDERSHNVLEPAIIEEFVSGKGHGMTESHNGTDDFEPGPKMGYGPKEREAPGEC